MRILPALIVTHFLALVRREIVAVAGMAGTALTVLAHLSMTVPMAPFLRDLLVRWRELTHSIWQPVLELLGISVHPHLAAALSVAVLLAVIGIGARISAHFADIYMDPITPARFLDDMSWPSLAVFAALIYVFLIGSGPDPASAPPVTLYGSETLGRYLFAIIVTVGYVLGDFFGHKPFHRRLLHSAVLTAALLAIAWASAKIPPIT